MKEFEILFCKLNKFIDTYLKYFIFWNEINKINCNFSKEIRNFQDFGLFQEIEKINTLFIDDLPKKTDNNLFELYRIKKQ